MGLDLSDDLVKLKITESVCGFVAICATVSRMRIRWGRFWWDDAWAVFSMLNLFVQIAGVFMHVDDPHDLSKTNRVAAYYLIATTFYTVIWSARLSILFSIIRIDPNPLWDRRLKYIAGLFIIAIFFFLAQLLWVCEPKQEWKNRPSPQCPLTKDVAICQLVSDVIADLLLIALPLRLIRSIRETALRRRLIAIFSTSIVTTIVSLVHASYIITTGGIDVIISALVEDCMSLTVANVPVVATALIRKFAVATSRDADVDVLSDDTSPNRTHWSTFRFRSFYTTRDGGETSKFGVSLPVHTTAVANVTTVQPPSTGSAFSSEPNQLDTKVPVPEQVDVEQLFGSLKKPAAECCSSAIRSS